jgi:hypothetical protein
MIAGPRAVAMLACMIARPLAITGMIFGSVLASRGDEGMWLFTHPPVRQVAEKYGFEITQEWLDHLRKSAVHFGGGSGSFVSREGLILTNHHVGSGVIERLSSAERNLLHDGFLAPDPASEIPCPGMELSVLMSIEDMTEQINGAVAADLNPDEAAAARRAAIATIERESLESTGLRSRVVTLFQGGLYHLYRYRHFTDVRLVFAPDARAAAFGGDPDNFEYPRYCMDYCFFRVYEDGKPAATPDFLTSMSWSSWRVIRAAPTARSRWRRSLISEITACRSASLNPCAPKRYYALGLTVTVKTLAARKARLSAPRTAARRPPRASTACSIPN